MRGNRGGRKGRRVGESGYMGLQGAWMWFFSSVKGRACESYKAKAHCCCSVPVEVPTLWKMVQETRDSYASEVL